jgi:MoxR-vWA-beta-propeller ternary system domain bpX2
MTVTLAECCCARLPAAMLPHLAPLRATPELCARIDGGNLWLFWPTGDAVLTRTLLALDGIELFGQCEGRWYRPGQHLPVFDVTSGEPARPLSSVLTPAAIEPLPPGGVGLRPVPLRLVACDQTRPCTLMRLPLAELARWAEHATSHQLSSLSAVHDGSVVLMRGERLPALTGERFWGRRLFFPLGLRPEPDLAEDILATALRLEAGDVALVTETGVELIPTAAFTPLTRAGVRLAMREVSA